jgi:hypothetical protein
MDKLDLLRDDEFENKPPTKWDLFEAMDRVSVQMNQLSDSLNNHPGFNEDQAKKASQAFSLLFDIYQIAGKRFFEATEGDDDKNSPPG